MHKIKFIHNEKNNPTDTPTPVLNAAIKGVNELITQNGLKIKSSKIIHRKNHKLDCDEFEITLGGSNEEFSPQIPIKKGEDVSASFANRKIKLRVFKENSDTSPKIEDLKERHNSILETVKFYLNGKEKISEEKKEEIIKKCESIPKGLLKETEENLKQEGKDINHEIYQSQNLKEPLTRYLSEIINVLIENEVDETYEHDDWVKEITDAERKYTSSINRDITAHLFPVKDKWSLDLAIPFSNVATTLRDGTGKILPNWYKNQITTYNAEGKKICSFSAERSASATAIAKAEKDERLKLNREIAEKKLRKNAVDKIIKKLNSKKSNEILKEQEIENIFKPKILFLTLISPIISRKLLPRALKKKLAIFGKESEYGQLKETIKSFNSLSCTLNDEDIEYIKNHVKSLPPELEQKLRTTEITPTMMHQNSPVNVFKNVRLDPFGIEKNINLSTREQILEDVQTKLAKINLTTESGEKLFDFLNKKKHSSQKAWSKDRDKFLEHIKILEKEIITLKSKDRNAEEEETLKNLIECKKTAFLLCKYLDFSFKKISFLKKLQRISPRGKIALSQEERKENYMLAASTLLLAENLGYDKHSTCKSGEDRTGEFFNVTAAFNQVINEEDHNINLLELQNEEEFIEQVWYAEKSVHQWGCSRNEVTNANCLGARGLQGMHLQIPIDTTEENFKGEELEAEHLSAKTAKGIFNAEKLTLEETMDDANKKPKEKKFQGALTKLTDDKSTESYAKKSKESRIFKFKKIIPFFKTKKQKELLARKTEQEKIKTQAQKHAEKTNKDEEHHARKLKE